MFPIGNSFGWFMDSSGVREILCLPVHMMQSGKHSLAQRMKNSLDLNLKMMLEILFAGSLKKHSICQQNIK